MKKLAIALIVCVLAPLSQAAIFECDFQGSPSGSNNLLQATQSERNTILDAGTAAGSWSDNDTSPNNGYGISEDESGNKVMVFAHEDSGFGSEGLADLNFASVVDLAAGETLTLDWDWMHTDEGGGGIGKVYFDLYGSDGTTLESTVTWEDQGQLYLDNGVDNPQVGGINRELSIASVGVDGLSTNNWNPLSMSLEMTDTSVELTAGGTVLTNMAGSFSDVGSIRIRSYSNRTYSEAGAWIDNIAAIPEPATIGLLSLVGIGAAFLNRLHGKR